MKFLQHGEDHLFFLGRWAYKAEVMSSLREGKEPWMLETEVTSAPCPGNWQGTNMWRLSPLIPQLVRVTWTPEVMRRELPKESYFYPTFIPLPALPL